MHPDESPNSYFFLKTWQLPAFRWSRVAPVLAGLVIAAYAAGYMVGHEQERDLQRARQSACEADPHCLVP